MMKFFLRIVTLIVVILVVPACADRRSTVERLEDALLSYSQGQHQRAKIELKNVLQSNPENADARLLLGRIYLDSGDPDSAVKELEFAQKFGMSRESVLPPLSRALSDIGDFDRLQAIDTTGLTVAAQADVLAAKAMSLLVRGEDAKARIYLDTALEVAPDSVYPQIVYAQYYLQGDSRDNALARQSLEAALSLDPESSPAWSMLGGIELNDGELEKAEQAFLKAIENSVDNVKDLLQLVIVKIEQKHFDEAERLIRELSAIVPQHPGLPYAQGLMALRQFDLLRAQEFFAEAANGEQVY
ncbi:MAG: hypothetical protein DRR42_25910, partial [Gammaproteobacteria bacterium]